MIIIICKIRLAAPLCADALFPVQSTAHPRDDGSADIAMSATIEHTRKQTKRYEQNM